MADFSSSTPDISNTFMKYFAKQLENKVFDVLNTESVHYIDGGDAEHSRWHSNSPSRLAAISAGYDAKRPFMLHLHPDSCLVNYTSEGSGVSLELVADGQLYQVVPCRNDLFAGELFSNVFLGKEPLSEYAHQSIVEPTRKVRLSDRDLFVSESVYRAIGRSIEQTVDSFCDKNGISYSSFPKLASLDLTGRNELTLSFVPTLGFDDVEWAPYWFRPRMSMVSSSEGIEFSGKAVEKLSYAGFPVKAFRFDRNSVRKEEES